MVFNETREVEYHVVRFNVVHGTQSNLVLRICDCTRTIVRWSNGNEVLTHYKRYDPPRGPLGPCHQLIHETNGWRVDTQDKLRRRIATDLFNHYDQGKNYDWKPLARFLSAHIHGNGGGGANFNIEVEQMVVDQAVVDQNNRYWQTYFQNDFATIANNQRIPDACPICYGTIANAPERIGLECGHVYCKECLYKWVWRRNSCPTCRVEV